MAKTLETISTSQMISSVASKFEELPRKITKKVIHDFLKTIEHHISGGNKVRIDSVGILLVKDRAARLGRNPQTGEEIKIPASKKISFRASKSLKELVSGLRRNAGRKALRKNSKRLVTTVRKAKTTRRRPAARTAARRR